MDGLSAYCVIAIYRHPHISDVTDVTDRSSPPPWHDLQASASSGSRHLGQPQCQANTGLWLVERDHVTWILATDWSKKILQPEYSPLIGRERSRDLDTGLWLAECDHLAWIGASDWLLNNKCLVYWHFAPFQFFWHCFISSSLTVTTLLHILLNFRITEVTFFTGDPQLRFTSLKASSVSLGPVTGSRYEL